MVCNAYAIIRRFLLALLVFASCWAHAVACPTGYSTTVPIAIQPQVYLSGALSNFPMLFTGSQLFAGTANPPGKAALSTGVDIIFCDAASSGNLLAYELVANTYSTTTGAGEWWIKVPTLSNSAVQTIYAFVGNASGTDHSAAATVWSAYSGVWHYGTASSISVIDSTGNNTAINHGATATAGEVQGGGAYASASSQWTDTGNLVTGLTSFTVEAWLNPATSSDQRVFSNQTTTVNSKGILLHDNSGTLGVCYFVTTAIFSCRYTSSAVLGTTGPYAYFAGSHTGGSANQVAIYFQGQPVTGTPTSSGSATDPADSGVNLIIGRNGNASTPAYYNGKLDEIRFAKAVLTADWIAADYFTIINPTSIYQIAPSPPVAFINPVLNAASESPYSASTVTCDLTNLTHSSVTTGDPIIVIIHNERGTITSPPTDTCGTAFGSPIDTVHYNDGSFDYYTESWVGAAACTGTDLISWTTSTTFGASGACIELDKNQYTTTVDYHNGGVVPLKLTAYSIGNQSTVNRDFVVTYLQGEGGSSTVYPVPPAKWVAGHWGQLAGAAYGIGGYAGSTLTHAYQFSVAPTAAIVQWLTLSLKPVAISIITSTIPTGSLGSAYYYAIPAVGGVGPYTWSKTAGNLFGLSLNSSTGEITGTPTSGGTSSVTFQVTDGTNTTTKTISFTVNISQQTAALIDECGTASNTSCALAAVSSGDTIVAMQFIAYHGGYNSLNPPTDSLGTVFHFVDACYNALEAGSGLGATGEAYYIGTATSSGADTLVPTPNNTPSHAYAIFGQFRNVQAFFDQEVCTTGSSAASATITSGNLPVVVPNSMMFAEANFGTSPSGPAAVAPFTLGIHDTSGGLRDLLSEYDIGATTGNYTPQMTQATNTNGTWNMGAISLRPKTTGTVSVSGVYRHRGIVY